MAVTAITVVATAPTEVAPHSPAEVAKKRRRRRPKRVPSSTSVVSSSSDDSSSIASSSTSNNVRRRRRRQKNKKNKNYKSISHQQVHGEQELSFEERNLYVALDCEMVGVGPQGSQSAVARVTLVGWDGDLIFDEFVRPEATVTDYRTFVSGITPEDIQNAPLSLEICRERLSDLLSGRVLVGHALKNDMKALGMNHPWYMTRDTAKFAPFMQDRIGDGILWPRKLKDLTKEKLDRDIQVEGSPHSSFEDALAAMDLYRSVRRKWEKAVAYKIKKTSEILLSNQQRAKQQLDSSTDESI